MNRTTWLGIVIALFGVAVWVGFYLPTRTIDWESLRMPISLAPGHYVSPDFKLKKDFLYIVGLEVEPNLPSDELNCRLGTAIFDSQKKVCELFPSVVNLTWVVVDWQGHAVAEGTCSPVDATGATYSSTITRELGRFNGRSGETYRLIVDVHQDGRALDVAKPRFTVNIHRSAWEDRIIFLQLAAMFAVCCVIAGATTALIGVVRYRRRKSIMVSPV